MQTTQNITLKRLLAIAAERQASDLHLVVGNKPTLRVGGKLSMLDTEEVVTQDFLEGVIEVVLERKAQQKLEKEREVVGTYDFVNHTRFRVDVNFQRGLPSLTFHLLSSVVRRLRDLGFPKEVEELTTQDHGLIFVGGPQGSGKTTTIAAMVESINHREAKHILMLERPVEYSLVSHLSIIEQQEIGKDVTDWPTALEIAEQDVDVLVIGKVESPPLWEKILMIASGGVLVIVGVEITATDRLFEYVVSELSGERKRYFVNVLADVYRGSVIQKLLPRVGGGEVLAIELAIASQGLAAVIREKKFVQVQNIIQTSRSEGMISMDRYIAELVKSGQVDRAAALKEVRDSEGFKSMLQR